MNPPAPQRTFLHPFSYHPRKPKARPPASPRSLVLATATMDARNEGLALSPPRSETAASNGSTTVSMIRQDIQDLYDRVALSVRGGGGSRNSSGYLFRGADGVAQRGDTQRPMVLNVVDWNGEDDPLKPVCWSARKKMLNTVIVCLLATTSYVYSRPFFNLNTASGYVPGRSITDVVVETQYRSFTFSVLAPALEDLKHEFPTTTGNLFIAPLAVSSYLLGHALSLLVISPLSQRFGRVWMYHLSNAIFMGATAWCASTHSFPLLAVARFVAGVGGSAAFALAPLSLMDMYKPHTKGRGVAFISLAISWALGDVAASFVGGRWEWRWVFWGTGLGGVFCTVLSLLGLSETCSGVVLERKAKRLRKITGNKCLRARIGDDGGDGARGTTIPVAFTGSKSAALMLRMVVAPRFFAVSLVSATGLALQVVLYGLLPEIFVGIHAVKSIHIGYVYLAPTVGNIVGIGLATLLSTTTASWRHKRGDEDAKWRVLPTTLCWPLAGAGMLLCGWMAEKQVHWIIPLIAAGIAGIGVMSTITLCMSYVLAAYPISPHSQAAVTGSLMIHSIVAGVPSIFAGAIFQRLGIGLTFTVYGSVALAMSPVMLIVFQSKVSNVTQASSHERAETQEITTRV
ncbi:unnamed protein product [Periconia digitata]|uniref:Major facilitator superfamily (MFS) profile domain-containing protein n=1 Tax=Periconia digitata TaxID=1303443 RepID=A0A9W4USP8_9PLEO|nr:unnamed protein product [Periconia digitata]